MINHVLLNARANDARLVLSFTLYALYVKRYTLVKQGGDYVTVSANTYETPKEMTRTHPNQSPNISIFLIILANT